MIEDDPFRCFVPYPPAKVSHASSGALSGLTLAVKDLFDIKGYPTGAGSPTVLAQSGIKTRTAPVVKALLDTGARFVGKTHTDELAFSLNGKNAHFGAPVNPAAPDRITGGSSSGSMAAVAGRLADIALGSDTGGSVRAPASYGGLFGIRPSHGRLSLKRAWPLAESFDTAGFFARDGETFARVAEVLFGKDRVTLPERPRLLLADDLFAQAVPEAERILRNAVQRIVPLLGQPQSVRAVRDMDALYWAFRWLQGREAWTADGPMIERFAPPLGPGVAERFAFGRSVSDAEVARGEAVRRDFRARLAKLLGQDGVLLLPTVPDIAPLVSAGESELDDFRNRALRLLCLAGLSGFPQISIPVAHRDDAPLGLSVIGPKGSDKSLTAFAVRVERAARIRLA
ncbi:amidase [Bosea sp. (in: a-proteobacteria)]|jgi:amidase|uniref:amidase n=1 Tax=Bosea sp. (in: a-proteobacteria) TaxID=1871050 RepID=UPI00086F1F9F|nr:amidase [Bosea sp. (in: a-proteobacteria)]MBN9436626.1 amidase [Bosea sp. (in: a-proteobacteria)]ODT44708.1 MAG: amidase [Methylobacterium sp. SCN 67-24]